MKKQTAIILLTVSGFGVGLGTGLWLGLSHVPATPPPAWLFTEFRYVTKPGDTLQNIVQNRPDLWREINAALFDIKPQIDEFRTQLHEIDGDFRRDFESFLTDEQKKKLALAQQRKELPRINTNFSKPAEAKPNAAAAPAPAQPAPTVANAAKPPATAASPSPAPAPQPSDKQPRMYQENADGLVASIVFVPYTLTRFTEALNLDSEQQNRLKELLLSRRERFIKLCDDTPPPSLQLLRIADIIRRAETEEKK